MSKPILGFLVSRIFGVPLLLTESKLHEILNILGPRINMDITNIKELSLSTALASPKRANISYTIDPNGIATIPIHGTLVHRSHGINALSGLTSYDQIRTDFNNALEDPSAETILLDIDSHGGEVAGLFDLVDEMYSARGTKPIVAMVNDSGYSAAYALASTADKIYLSRTAGVGSIGVMMIHADYSDKDKQAGIKYTTIQAGARKADFSPHAPLSREAHAIAQDLVNSVYSVFVSTVARNNGLSESEVINTQAAIYQGQKAVDAGLADAVLSHNEITTKLIGGITMPIRNAQPANAKEQLEQQALTDKIERETRTQTAGTEQLDTVQDPEPAAPETSIPDNTVDATQAERNRVLEILECCTLVGHQELAIDLISDGSSADAARKMILTVLSAKSDQECVVSTVNPAKSSGMNPLLVNAKKRAEEARR